MKSDDFENNNETSSDDFDINEFRYTEESLENLIERFDKEMEEPFVMVRHKGIYFPQPLKKGDKVAFLSPASAVKEEYVKGAMKRFKEHGYEPVLMPHAVGEPDGSYSAIKGDRLLDLIHALEDREIKAIFCNRGGYGCVQLLQNFSYSIIANNPKWLIGFSDVSALLAMWYRSDIASIHGLMAKHLATEPADDPCSNALFNILETGGRFSYLMPSTSEFNNPGEATGILRGGNWAVLNGLANTPYDILDLRYEEKDIILFLEDISEPIYALERMLWRLSLSGTLLMVKGIIFCQFTEYKPDKNFETVEQMLVYWLERLMVPPIPIVFNFPVGHVKANYPLTEGAKVELSVTEDFVSLKTLDPS